MLSYTDILIKNIIQSNPLPQPETISQLSKAIYLSITALVLENLSIDFKKEIQQIISDGNLDNLIDIAYKKIPNFETKLNKVIESIRKAYLEEINYA